MGQGPEAVPQSTLSTTTGTKDGQTPRHSLQNQPSSPCLNLSPAFRPDSSVTAWSFMPSRGRLHPKSLPQASKQAVLEEEEPEKTQTKAAWMPPPHHPTALEHPPL